MKTRCNGFTLPALGLAAGGHFGQKSSDERVPGRLLVQTVHGVSDWAAIQAIALASGKVHHKIDQNNILVLAVPEPALDTNISVYIDKLCSDTLASYSCNWNTKKYSSNSHTITATAWDAAGNAGYATPVTA